MSDHIRIATEDDLQWLRKGFDPKQLEEQVREEIEEAQTATSTPRHWRPVEVEHYAALREREQSDRCLCGHFRSEHDGRCHGAYGTLTPDADDESVEVCCPCDHFYKVDANYFPVRR